MMDDIEVETVLILEQSEDRVFEVAKMTNEEGNVIFALSLLEIKPDGNPELIGSPSLFLAEELLDLSAALRNIANEQLNEEDAKMLGLSDVETTKRQIDEKAN